MIRAVSSAISPSQKPITQRELALHLGVSRSTVASILSGKLADKCNYSEETRKRVLKAAADFNYLPDQTARRLKTGSSNIIMVVQSGSGLPLTQKKVEHIVQSIRDRGFEPQVYQKAWANHHPGPIVNAIREARAYGVILVDTSLDPTPELPALLGSGIPMVHVSGRPTSQLPHLGADRRDGFRLMTQHLLELGYRKLVLVTRGAADLQNAPDAVNLIADAVGFQSAVAAFDAKIESEVLLIPCEGMSSHDPYFTGSYVIKKLLQRGALPEALLLHNDNWAFGAGIECLHRGIKVPDDLALTGFDHTVIAQYTPSPLTTVEYPVQQIAISAVDLLIQAKEGKPCESRLLPCRLILRESCGRLLPGRGSLPSGDTLS